MKRVFAAVLLVVLAVTLAGCHGANYMSTFMVPLSFDTSRNYTITFWAKNDTNKAQTAVYEKAIEDFEKLYPNIHVEYKPYTDYSRIYSDVLTNIQTGTTPNVCITYPDHIATYMSSENCVVALDELLTHPKYGLGGSEVLFDSPAVGEIIPKFLGECKIGEHYYALPYMRSTEAMYVNKTYVEKLGYALPETLTWDFVWEVSEAAMQKDENGNFLINGQGTMIPFIYKSTDNMMIQMLRQLNAPYSTENAEILIDNETTKSLLFEIAQHAETRAFSTFKISSYPANKLNAGQCIFAIDSTAGATWMGPKAPLLDIPEEEIRDFEIEVMTIPQFDPENPKMISQGPSMCIFNKEDPQEVLASWLFMQYLLTNEVQIGYATTEGYLPVTSKAHASPEYTDYLSRMGEDNAYYYDVKIKASRLLLENLDNTFVTPVFNGSASLRNVAGELIESVTKSKRRRETVDDAYMDKLFTDVYKRFKLDTIVPGASVSGGAQGSEDAQRVMQEQLENTPLPTTAVVLIVSLLLVWLAMFFYVIVSVIKRKILINTRSGH